MQAKLSLKFIFITVLGIIVVMVGVAVPVVNLERKSLLEKAEKAKEVLFRKKYGKVEILLNNLISKGKGLIGFIAKIAPESIRAFDFARLGSYVSEICEDREILYAVFYDKDGKALTLGKVLGPSEDILELERKCIDEYGVEYGTIKIGLTKRYLREAVEKTEAGISEVILQMERETGLALKRVFTRVLTLFMIGVLILSVVLYFAFDRMVIRPIYGVSGTLNDIARGNFEKRIAVKSHDEIGDLAASLNKMAEDLQKTTVSRDALAHEVNERRLAERQLGQYRDHLEDMVEQRTKELRDAQEELRKSKQHFQTLFEKASFGIMLVSRDKEILNINAHALRVLQRKKQDVIGKTCQGLICPAARGECPKLDKGETISESERIILGPNGQKIPVLKSVSSIEIGGEQFLLETFIDITERKQAAEKILEQSEFLKRTIESLAHPFYVVDANDYRIIMANSAAAAPGALTDGVTCYSLTHKSDKPCENSEHICPLKEVKKNKKPVLVEHVHHDGNGNERLFEVHGYPVFDKEGNVVQMIEYSLDITERKQAEEELKKTHLELVKSSRLAGMSEVATDILHNVGNVLNSVNVSTTLMTKTLSNSKVPNLKKVTGMIRDHMEKIGTFLTEDPQGKHIPKYLTKVTKLLADEQADIYKKLLDLAGNVNHIKEIVNMQQSYAKVCGVEVSTTFDEVIEAAIQINKAGLKPNGIKVIREYAELGNVSIDKQRVLQILVNLINNAKYALVKNEKEEKLLTIGFYRHGEDRIRIEVADNGIGISKENVTKIFGHGFTTKRDGHGFGLHSGALAAKEMGGSLIVQSDGPEKGSTFTLELPYKP